MKKIFVMLALTMGVVSANAQSVDSTAVTTTVTGDVTLTADIYPQQEDGDIYHGLTKKLTFDRMIPPYGLEVTYDKTTHIIFPAAVRYVDLGSPNLIAGKADGSENVIRVKATVKGQFLCQTVIDVAILLLRIDVRSEGYITGYCVSYCG